MEYGKRYQTSECAHWANPASAASVSGCQLAPTLLKSDAQVALHEAHLGLQGSASPQRPRELICVTTSLLGLCHPKHQCHGTKERTQMAGEATLWDPHLSSWHQKP